MSSKYRGLPDIDTAPDLFETPDEPEGLLRPNDNYSDDELPSKSTSEAIDSAKLPRRKDAERVFGRGTRRKDPSNPSFTFRPRLPPLSRRASSSSSSSGTEPDPSSRPKESAVARIRRLKAELAEVEKEVASTPTSASAADVQGEGDGASGSRSRIGKRRPLPRQGVDVLSELSALRERLDRVDIGDLPPDLGNTSQRDIGDEWKERLGRLIAAENRGSAYQQAPTDADIGVETGTKTGKGGAELSELDKRLAVLEDLVGPISDGLDQSTSAPLLSTLNKHDHLLALLTQPRHLDAISRRVKLLLVDLDRAAAASRRPGTGSAIQSQGQAPDGSSKGSSNVTLSQNEYTTLQNLFTILPRLDPILPILSPLLSRLKSLSVLHSETSEIASNLKKLQTEDKRGKEEKGELEEIVRNVEKGLEEAVSGIGKNWESLHGRIEGLEKRLKDLEVS